MVIQEDVAIRVNIKKKTSKVTLQVGTEIERAVHSQARGA